MFSIRASISVRDILFQLPESAVKDDLCPKHEKLLQQIYSSCVCERTNFYTYRMYLKCNRYLGKLGNEQSSAFNHEDGSWASEP
jgi:hypothetical protein